MTSLIIKAAQFAAVKHKDQRRKYANVPYFEHLARTAQRVMLHEEATESLVAAAYLHDVVEDNHSTFEEVENQFGFLIKEHVMWLTNASKDINPRPPREERKRIDREKLAKAPPFVKIIKMIDRSDNLRDMMHIAPKDKIQRYCEESALLVEAIGDASKDLKLVLLEDIANLLNSIR